MCTNLAQDRLEVRQIYRLLQFVNEVNKPQVEKLLQLGVENLILLQEPRDSIGALHAATLANNLGDGTPKMLWIYSKLKLVFKYFHKF